MDKNEAIRQIEAIKRVVIDGGHILPDSPLHYYVWAVLSAVGIAVPYWIESAKNATGASAGVIICGYLLFMLIVGFTLSSKIFCDEMERTGSSCTPQLKALKYTYMLNLSFASVMTLVLAAFGDRCFIGAVWLFLVGAALFAENTISKRFFGDYGLWMMGIALVFASVGYLWLSVDHTPSTISYITNIGDFLNFTLISGALAVMGAKLQTSRRNDV